MVSIQPTMFKVENLDPSVQICVGRNGPLPGHERSVKLGLHDDDDDDDGLHDI